MRVRGGQWLPWLVLVGCGRSGLNQSDIAVTPLEIQFGDVQLHASSTRMVTVSNSGLTPEQVRVQGATDGPFATGNMSFSLGVDGSIDIPVFFAPTELGSATGVLTIDWSTGHRDVTLAGSGTPFPCESTTPDGTPCQLWWAPCAVGASCRGGVCHSATAEAEVPGDLRWFFPVQGAMPLAADPLGNIYSLLASRMGVLAIDACGHQLWQTSSGYDFLLVGGDTLVASSTDGHVAGLSSRDGTTLWSADVGRILGCTGSGAPCTGLRVSAPILTNQGSLFVFATSNESAGGETVTRLDFALDGGVLGTASLAPEPRGFALGSVVGDTQGNSYFATYIDGMLADLFSYDFAGTLRFQKRELRDPRELAMGRDVVVGAGSVWSLDGQVSADIPSPNGAGLAGCGNSGAVDSDGLIYCFTSPDTHDGVMAVSPNGTVSSVWVSELPTGFLASSNLALGDPGTLFVYARPTNNTGENLLVAFAAADGGVLWTAGPFQTTQGPAMNGEPLALTLTPAATLVMSDQTAIYGVFAGPLRPPPGAFWSRFGGDDANRGVPAPTAVP